MPPRNRRERQACCMRRKRGVEHRARVRERVRVCVCARVREREGGEGVRVCVRACVSVFWGGGASKEGFEPGFQPQSTSTCKG